MPRRKSRFRALAALVAAALAGSPPAAAQVHQWEVSVASWNLLNFSDTKAVDPATGPRVNLLTRMGAVAGAYDILVFQEVLGAGTSVTAQLINYLPPGYVCNWLSVPSGRVGRQERYVICNAPLNATGAIAITAWHDYSIPPPATFLAADGTQQPAQNVWMRPPVIATVTYTPADPFFPAVSFDIYTNHTKPAYGTSAQARPPGTVAGAPNSSSVHYELRAIQNNLAAGVNRMLIGDLNADCASYPVMYRGLDFPAAAGWTWHIAYGTRTNTAVGTACAYDRIILNAPLQAFYRNHGVDYDHYGNATRIDTQRVSDHYPVWVRLGQYQNVPVPMIIASLSLPVAPPNKQAKYKAGDSVHTAGSGLKPSATAAAFYITPYVTTVNYKSNFTYTLTDVRGAPTPVTTDANGNMNQTVTWTATPGAFTFVFDANGDGKFRRSDGDFANNGVQADILVTSGTAGHNDLVTLGDDMGLRDTFDLGQAYNVYALAKNLPASTQGDLYIVSQQLLKQAGYANWAAARAARISLAPYSIPINLASTGMITTAGLTKADVSQPFTTTPSGELFMSAWTRPAQLMNAVVNYVVPPSSVYQPEFAGSGDPPRFSTDTNYDDDPCATAHASPDSNFQQACNVGFLFANYYGNAFNLVLDMNRDGKLNATDPIDLRDIGDMTAFFNGSATVLGPNANGQAAVGEYKEYLSRALSVSLTQDNTYDAATQAASSRYACGPTLSKAAFQAWITPDAQTGFRVLESGAYQSARAQGSGLQQYDDAFLDGLTMDDADLCISGEGLGYGGAITATNGSKVVAVAGSHRFEGATITSTNSTQCWAALAGETVASAALAFGAATGVFTLGTGTVLGVVVAAGSVVASTVACGL